MLEVKLIKKASANNFDITKIINCRTVRSDFLSDLLKQEEITYLVDLEPEFTHYLPNTSKESKFIDEQTIAANRLQSYRDPAQQELANWIRFSSQDADKYRDGLTTAGMEITGIPGWVVRNYYDKDNVMTKDFRGRGIDNIQKEISESAGWILITSQDDSVAALLETGRRMERLFLKVRGRNIAIHPMTHNVRIPAGAKPGSRIRLKGKGRPSPFSQQRGDLYLTIEVLPHSFFRFEGDNLVCNVPIRPNEAVLGAEIKVPTPDGSVTMKVPKGVKSGQSLKLRGKGWTLPKGRADLLEKE